MGMEAVMVVEVLASGPRERLVAFVGEVAGRLALGRQRDNALFVRAWLGGAGRAQELAADLVSVGADAGAIRVDAAVFGRLAVAGRRGGARVRGAGGAADRGVGVGDG